LEREGGVCTRILAFESCELNFERAYGAVATRITRGHSGKLADRVAWMPAPVGLGLTGEPLLVALVLSRVGRIGSLIWYLSPGATLVLREIGIVLFLVWLGLKSGTRFLDGRR